jgi:PAS domain S-box-containing protein
LSAPVRRTAHGNGANSIRHDAAKHLDLIAPRLQQIHETASDFGVFALDAAGRIATWNVFAGELTGYSAAEILGKDFSCLYPTDESTHGNPARALAVAAAEGRFEERGPRLRRDGSRFPAEAVIVAVRDATGDPCGFACMIRDLSDHRRAEEQALRLANELRQRIDRLSEENQHLAKSRAPDIPSRQKNWPSANESAESGETAEAQPRETGNPAPLLVTKIDREGIYKVIEGRMADEGETTTWRALGQSVFDVHRHDEGVLDSIRRALAGETSMERTTVRGNLIEVWRGPIRDAEGNIAGAFSVSTDITARTRTEEELQARLRQQEAITQLGARSLEGGDRHELMTDATRVVTSGLNVDISGVLELDEDGRNLTISASSEPEPGFFVGKKAGSGEHSLAGYTLISSGPVISKNLLTEIRFRPRPQLIAYGARSAISVSIKSKGAALGVLAAFSRTPRSFSHDDINFMQAVANILAGAIERSRAEERLRRNEEYLRTVIESSSDVIAVLDRASTIRFVSGSGEAMFGRTVPEMIGRTASEFAHPDDIAVRDRLFEAAVAKPGVAVSDEVRIRKQDGSYLACEVVMRSLADIGGAPGILVNIRDISERKRNELELARARDAALESSRLKSAFLANMSHEFRTPLNIILGYSDLIGEHLAEMQDSSQEECLEAVTRACKRLLRTLNAILDYSKLEARSFTVNPATVNLVPLIERLIADMMPQAASKGLSLEFAFDEEAATAEFDEYCLTQALRNLLENAIKFTERGGATVRLYREAIGALRIRIADTGIGIDAAFLPHLLEPFSQEDYGMSRRFEGAGLGLALTRRYLELNGASLSVRSEKDTGSTFTIHFAQTEEAERDGVSRNEANPPDAAAHDRSHQARILVVEDDPDNQILMRALLKSRYRLLIASSAEEVRRQIETDSEPIDLILMDLGLGCAEDGLMLTRSLRETDRFRATPIVALTGHAMTVNRERALDAGCNDFIIKPFDRARLFDTIEHLLDGASGNVTEEVWGPD